MKHNNDLQGLVLLVILIVLSFIITPSFEACMHARADIH